ncbi:hypothetical protein [Planomicrobium sp. CPCC 101079]|uniref:hypothetical protein n=1 Tax=Planomicrobium sp. CPCC 101079 TaxID=2599618 RepID=UPI0011B8579D|nr:hypothetical protein [Planomicrobium sp. CPCC 101079]TWT00942.1 hypothetical protein FQV28_16250 [Planomicrobium sp. CPCC 101079]
MPEEFPAFTFALSRHPNPFPTEYWQWAVPDPTVVNVCMESMEPQKHVAERLAAALQVIDQ